MSPTEVVVEWTEVDAIERNGIIIAYEVVYVPLDSIGVADVRNTSNTTIRLEGLEESVEYTIRVRAFTRVGPGPFSDPRNSTAQEDGRNCYIITPSLSGTLSIIILQFLVVLQSMSMQHQSHPLPSW